METCPLSYGGPVAEITLAYKRRNKKLSNRHIGVSKDAYDTFICAWNNDIIQLIEQFKILFLDHGSRCLATYTLSTGGMTSTVVDPRLIFVAALKIGATKFIVAHNHPSGNLTPSEQDIVCTNKLVSAGKVLEIALVDHLIISWDGYFSFADHGLL